MENLFLRVLTLSLTASLVLLPLLALAPGCTTATPGVPSMCCGWCWPSGWCCRSSPFCRSRR